MSCKSSIALDPVGERLYDVPMECYTFDPGHYEFDLEDYIYGNDYTFDLGDYTFDRVDFTFECNDYCEGLAQVENERV